MADNCPLCESRDLFIFLERVGVPVHQNLPADSRSDARSMPRGDLRIGCCRNCGFVSNLAFRQDLLSYGAGYENDQTWSPRFEKHVDALVSDLLEGGAHGKLVVEVGCGRGHFLQKLCERGSNRGVGFDPAYQGPDVSTDGRMRFVRDYYGARYADVHPDVVVCRHVIEHIPRPAELLAAIHTALEGVASPLIAFETPTVDWILEGTVIQDFFFEHCSYFTPASLAYAFQRAGFSPQSVERVFDGQYIWLRAARDARPAAGAAMPAGATSYPLVESCTRYREREQARIARLRVQAERMRREGPVAVWWAGAKGVTFLNVLDPAAELVDSVVDINPRKQGKFIPCTGHPIIGVDDIRCRDIAGAIVMNGNYLDEIRTMLTNAGIALELHAEAEL